MRSVWVMHLVAVTLVTLACIGAVLWLSLTDHSVPDLFTIVATGGATYLLGTQTAAQRDKRKPPQ